MRGIQATVAGRVISVALSGALVLGNLGFAGTTALAEPPVAQAPVASDPTPTIVREIPENRTATSQEYLLSNGSIRALYHSEPVNFQDASGAFTPIDPTLKESSEGGRAISVSRANSVRLVLPQTLGEDGASVETSAFSVSITPAGALKSSEAQAAAVPVAARSDSATERAYPAAFEGATLSYESRNEGLKESIVLGQAPAKTSFPFAMRLSGLTPRLTPEGSVLLEDALGVMQFRIPKPFMTDSSRSTIGADYSDAVHYELSGGGPEYRLVVVADPSWIADPARVFPVIIDPSVETSAATLASANDAFISSAYQSTNYSSHSLVWIDNHAPGADWTEYGYAQPPPILVSGMATKKALGKYVVASRLKMFFNYANIASAGEITGYMVTTATASNLTTITWGGYANPPYPGSGVATCQTPYAAVAPSGGNTKILDVTDMAAYWQDAATSATRCIVKIQGSAATHAGFNSADNGSYKPIWEVDYAQVPTVTLSTPTTGTVTSIPNASWTMTDTGTGFPQAEWALEVATSETGAAIASTGAANAATSSALPVPSGGFVANTKYYVRVKAASSPTTQTPRLWSAFDTGNFTPVLPSAVTSPSVSTTASAGWFYESDTNGDGLNDLACNVATQGRGAAILSWPAATGATGYHVYLHDGYTYRQVATTTATSWSSSAKGLYRTDSQIASLSLNTTSNPYLAGTGLDLRDDGRPLYARTAGSSLDTTRAFAFKVSPYNANGEVALSADATAWARLADRTVHLSEYPTATLTSPSTGATALVPAMRWNYTSATGHAQVQYRIEVATSTASAAIATTDVRSAATSVSMPVPAGGFEPRTTYYVRVKVANEPNTGVPLWSSWSPWADFSIGAPLPLSELSYSTTASANWFAEADTNGDGLNDLKCDAPDYGRGSVTLTWLPVSGATGYTVYLHDGNAYRQVASTTATSWSSAGKGIFPSDSQIASLSAETTSNPYLAGTGLDLRDDPRGLYARTAGSSLDATAGYLFEVVPYNGAGECTSQGPEALAVLEGRTTHVADAPNHAFVDLQSMLGHDAAVQLDTGDITLSATDLEIASWGPRARLDRHYSSSTSDAPSFAPGWRFGFERSLVVSGGVAVYTDEYGDAYRYRASGPLWVPPVGDYSTLSTSVAGATITGKDRTVLSFDLAGQLVSEADANGNTVTYERGEDLTITAANGQRIVVDRDSYGTIRSAVYSTGAGMRRVDYSADPTPTVSYSFEPSSTQGYTVGFSYVSGRLVSLTCTQSGTTWGVEYGSGTSSVTVSNNSGDGSPSYRRSIVRDEASRVATVTTFDAVQVLAWNPSATLASKSNPGSASEITSWRYSPSNEQIEERSPAGRTLRIAYDTHGNVVADTDAAGIVTRYAYDGLDRVIWRRDPQGSETSRTYDAFGNVLVEERTVVLGGLPARTEWKYDALGRRTDERSRVDASHWMETSETAFASDGSPQQTTRHGVLLSVAGAPTDLAEDSLYNAFGNLLERRDVSGVTVTVATYDGAGRRLTSADASGVVSNTAYDALGRAVESWRSYPTTAAKLDWVVTSFDAVGNAQRVTRRDSVGATISTVSYLYDDLGRQLASDDSSKSGRAITEYDAAGREVRQWDEGQDTSAVAASVRTSWDKDGNEVSSLLPGATTSATVSTLDYAGRIERQQTPDGVVTVNEYDDAGALAAEAAPSDEGTATVRSSYELSGELSTQTAPNGVTTSLGRDLMGRTATVRSGEQSATTTLYNALGWVLQQADFDGVVTSLEYDANGRVVRETVGDLVTTHGFDGTGREVSSSNPDGSALLRIFDCFGRVATETVTGTDGLTAKEFTNSYDSRGRIASRREAVSSATVGFSYGTDGWTTITQARRDGVLVSTLDSTGLLRSLDGTLSGAHIDWSVTATDSAGRVVGATSATFVNNLGTAYDQAGRVVRPEGVSGGLGAWGTYSSPGGPQSVPPEEVSYTYSPTTGKKVAEHMVFNSGWSENNAYRYDINGRVASATVNASSTSYGYDPVSGALESVKPSGQPTVALSYDAAGRLAGVGTRTYASDAQGRRLYSGPSGNPSETAYTWRAQRLTGFRSSASTASYVYDASGQRTRSVVSSGSVTTTTTFDYDGLRLLGLGATRSDGATWSVDYLYDERGVIFAGAYRANDASPVAFLMVTTDRGDVRELIDVTGRSFGRYRYDAYGNVAGIEYAGTFADWNPSGVDTSTAAAITSRQVLRYAGYVFDEHSGMYYCSQRYYDPASYQWVNKDAAKADGEESAYQYCGGDPVANTDPSGLSYWLSIWSVPFNTQNLVGHSWLQVDNYTDKEVRAAGLRLPAHQEMSVSFYPDGVRFGAELRNILKNRKIRFGLRKYYQKRASYRVVVSKAQLDQFSDDVLDWALTPEKNNSYTGASNVCTTFTVKVWNDVVPKPQFAGYIDSVTEYGWIREWVPQVLWGEIRRTKGFESNRAMGKWRAKLNGHYDSTRHFVKDYK